MSLFHTQVNESPDLDDFIRNLEESAEDMSYTILRMVGQEALKYLKDYTSRKTDPRYRRKMGPDPSDPEFRIKYFKYQQRQQDPNRPTHPGGWGDISHDLVDGYYARTEKVDAGWQLTLGNKSGHAGYVEAKDGYFVISGVMDPGGPVDKAIRKAFRRLNPSWKITNTPGKLNIVGDVSSVQQSLFASPISDSVDGT